MGKYASQTTVASEKSRIEIEQILRRYGATQFAYGWQPDGAVVQFSMNDRSIRFVVTMPLRDSREFTHTPSRRIERTPEDAEKAWEQATRQRWRALKLVIQAKLESVESGIEEFEEAFLSHILLPDQTTVGIWLRPQLAEIYRERLMPPMLPMLERGS